MDLYLSVKKRKREQVKKQIQGPKDQNQNKWIHHNQQVDEENLHKTWVAKLPTVSTHSNCGDKLHFHEV